MADKEVEEKIEHLQLFEQNLQALLMQKQTFQSQLLEAENSIEELKKAKENPYKIIGPIMVLSDKDKLKKELEDKKEMLNLRIKTIERQEDETRKKAKELQEEIMKSLRK